MKFLYGDYVKVISGFYQGFVGEVTDYSGIENQYYFKGSLPSAPRSTFSTKWINEQELEKVEE